MLRRIRGWREEDTVTGLSARDATEGAESPWRQTPLSVLTVAVSAIPLRLSGPQFKKKTVPLGLLGEGGKRGRFFNANTYELLMLFAVMWCWAPALQGSAFPCFAAALQGR